MIESVDNRCIYCGSQDLTEEHYLPEGLGRFRGYETLKNRICKKCQTKCSQLEGQLLRNSPEAFFRKLVGKLGKKHHKKIEIFYRRNADTDPIRIIATYPGEEYPVLWEPNEGEMTLREMRQIVVLDDSGNYCPIPISDSIRTSEDIKPLLEVFNGRKLKVVAVFADPSEYERMEIILSMIDSKLKISWPEKAPKGGQRIDFIAASRLTDKYYRAIAKIGFHYFIKMSEQFTGHEDMFNPIKNFIMDGGDWRSCVYSHEGNLVFDVNRRVRPKNFLHLLVAEKTYMTIQARMQLFLGTNVQPPIYTVQLARNPERVWSPDKAWGHSYVYFDNKDSEGYDGAMESLTTVNKAFLP